MKREELIQNIKDCGGALIDNAEKIVTDYEYRLDGLTITCYPDEDDACPYIEVNTSFIPRGCVERFQAR